MGEAVGRLFVGAGTYRNAEGGPLLSFRRPDRTENQHTEFAGLGRVLRQSLETLLPSGSRGAAEILR
jgi:hypothetical protein